MANLVELSNQLEYVPQEQLVQMSQDPNSMYPSFLVLSEIQRRNQMKKMYEAQQPKPQTTVAEEVVQEFAGQQGLQGAMAQPPGPQNAFQPGDMGNMAPPSPMQAMASGEKTSYKTGGLVDNFLSGDYGILGMLNNNPELMFGAAGLAAKNNFRGSLLGELYNQYKERKDNKEIEETEETIEAMAAGGRTGYNVGGSLGLGGDSLSKTFTNPMENQISNEELQRTKSVLDSLPKNEDGSVDKSAVAKAVGSGLLTATAVAALLFPEPTTSAAGAARLATTSFGRNLLQFPGKIKSRIQGYMGKRALSKDPMKRFGPEDAKGLKPLQTTKQIGQQEIKDLKIPTRAAGLVGLGVAGKMIDDGIEEPITEPTIDPTTTNTTDDSVKDIVSEDVETGRKGLGQKFDADMLVALGGAIGSAKNLGELSSGISKAYFDVKSSRDAKDLAGLQGRLIEAQISKYEADVANMPLDVAIKQYQSLNDLVDSGVLTADEAKIREAALIKRIQQLQGITVAEKDKRDELLGLVQEVG